MHIVVVGVTHRTAPFAVREKLSIPAHRLVEATSQLAQQKGVLEAVIVSTCNRTEFVVVVEQATWCPKPIAEFIERSFHCDRHDIAPYIVVHEDAAAVRYVYRMTTGLDSLICGETQILGQVRQAFLQAQAAGTTGTLLNQLFREAITIAKKAHTDIGINDRPVSLASVAVAFVGTHVGPIDQLRVVLIGAGEMGSLIAKHVHARGCTHITIANRSIARAQALADGIGASVCAYDERYAACAQADVVFTQVGAGIATLCADELRRIVHRPLCLIDMAIPRDVDGDAANIPGVTVYDVDDVGQTLHAHERMRAHDAARIDAYVDHGVHAYVQWVKELGVGPLIGALQARASDIHRATMDELRTRLAHLGDREWRLIHKLSKSMLTQLLSAPIRALKERAPHDDGTAVRAHFQSLFGIELDETVHVGLCDKPSRTLSDVLHKTS
jgi:glutamyl-tRNA reductase